mmetsp:Transcript_16314/g.24020  ORF Transcript_16314/g.24020 Transcript_16314/m.24020 type:complete len:475 (+) Transcript_16314:85-1509(+)|eukprot:CAMPEP_0194230294 /NCGR_PEP_ID=MMETSP0156-20130528/44337_1 /TAXON_ID=33649 /ORGANISM="Thalassionema nitzschioides, Strain L26-B" /LENGTH=474 /DNA_ID=CAMNT_0038962875 /DNA_START=13 /DNA_END=1437 /DNA_ORIENTATION=-
MVRPSRRISLVSPLFALVTILVVMQLKSSVISEYSSVYKYSASDNIAVNKSKPQPDLDPLSDRFSSTRDGQNDLNYGDITFTRFGWFHPNSEKALSFGRTQTSKHLMEAILQHERYNRSAWDDLDRKPDASRPIIAFLDIETCGEINWPNFGGDFNLSSDKSNGRARVDYKKLYGVCKTVREALDSPAIKASPHSRLVILNCAYPVSHEDKDEWFPKCANKDRDPLIYEKLVIAHLSKHQENIHPTNDFGIPPLPARPVDLNSTELKAIENCDVRSRKYFFSFEGRARIYFPEFRQYFEKLHGTEGVHAVFGNEHYKRSNQSNSQGQKVLTALSESSQKYDPYYNLLRQSIFTGTPRGDKLFSYRFSEVLSAGSIPVVYADNYVLPYTKDVVHWDGNSVAVIIPQKHVNQTMDILKNFTDRQICSMQQNALQFYNDYVKDSVGRLRGIMQVLDSRLKRFNETGSYGGVFSAVPS